jgi:uncharacterized protein (DUF1501 family)
MKRRNFLKNISQIAATQVAIGGLSFQVKASEFAWLASKAAATNNRILVIVQLSGGNDGLNMAPPLNQMSQYLSLRPTIGLAENTILPLGTSGAGFHPAMTGLKGLYDDGQLLLVQGLSYPNQSFSHFAATKIWNVGINNAQEDTGWMGRFLVNQFPDFPDTTYTDPVALQVEDLPSTLFSSLNGIMSSSYNTTTLNSIITNPLVNGGTNIGTSTGSGVYGDYLAFIQEQMLLSDQFAARIKQAGTLGSNANPNYPNTTLGNKLKVIAKLIRGGLNTKVYHVSLGGFDTHNDQLARQNTLLTELSGAITAFQKDLVAMGGGFADRVTGMTFSEFGRRAQENASRGTDHGTSVPMLVFGMQLNPTRMIGTAPDLSNLTANNLPTQFDFRQAYAAYLTDWFGLNRTDTNGILLQSQLASTTAMTAAFEPLPIFKTSDPCENTKCIPVVTKIIK